MRDMIKQSKQQRTNKLSQDTDRPINREVQQKKVVVCGAGKGKGM